MPRPLQVSVAANVTIAPTGGLGSETEAETEQPPVEGSAAVAVAGGGGSSVGGAGSVADGAGRSGVAGAAGMVVEVGVVVVAGEGCCEGVGDKEEDVASGEGRAPSVLVGKKIGAVAIDPTVGSRMAW